MQRIKNNKGATLPLALIFFVVCAVIGSTILTTGTVASNRVGGLISQQQPYYTTTSAAKMMKSILENTKVIHSDGSAKAYYKNNDSLLPSDFLIQVENAYEYIENDYGLPNKPVSFNIKTDNEALDITSLDSTFEVSTDENTAYDISINLKKESKDNLYQCLVYAPAVVTRTNKVVWQNSIKTTKTITTITWPKATIKSTEVNHD